MSPEKPSPSEAAHLHCPNPSCTAQASVTSDAMGVALVCKRCGVRLRPSASRHASGSRDVPVAVGVSPPPAPVIALPAPVGPLPEKIGRFEVRGLLGQGGFGRVFRAWDPHLEREVALKIPRPGSLNSPRRVERFLGDARSAARLRHPNIVPVFDAGQEGDLYFIAAAYVEGRTLAEATDQQLLPIREAVSIVRTLAEALAYAHRQAVVHRDVKPGNVVLDAQGQPHLIDFGLARRGEAAEEGRSVLGTPSYMSPEQASGHSGTVQPAADQYSLGVTLYELLCGRTPFSGPASVLMYHAINTQPPRPRAFRPDIPDDLELVCLRAMAKRPQDRYPDCHELAEDLRRWLDGEVPRVRTPGRRERLARWVRREPRLAAALGVAALAILTAGVIGLGFGVAQSRLRNQADRLAAEAVANADRADANARVAEENAGRAAANARQTQAALALSTFDRAVSLAEQGEAGQGLVWLTESLQLAQAAGDRDLERVIRVNLAGWRPHLHRLDCSRPHQTTVSGAVFHPQGRKFVTAGAGTDQGGLLTFWGLTEGPDAEISQPEVAAILGAPLRALALSPNGDVLATGGNNGEVRLWDATTGRPLAGPLKHPAEVHAVALSPDGCTVLSGCADGNAYLWRFPGDRRLGVDLAEQATATMVRNLPHRAGVPLTAVAFHPQGRLVLTAAGPGAASGRQGLLWDIASEEPPRSLGQGSAVRAAAFSPRGDLLAVAHGERMRGEVRLWVLTGTTLQPGPTLPHQAEVYALAFSPGGRLLASGGQDRAVRLWNPSNGHQVGQPLYHPRDVRGVTFTPDGRRVLTEGDDRVFRVWDVADPAPTRSVVPGGPVLTAQLCSGGRLFTGGLAGQFWDGGSGEKRPPGLEHPGPVWAFASSPDGKLCVTGGGREAASGVACVWDDNRTAVGGPLKHPGLVRTVALGPDPRQPGGHLVATGCDDGRVRVWGVSDLTRPRWELAHKDRVYAVTFSPDGRHLLTASRDRSAVLWDLTANPPRPAGRCEHPDAVLSAAFTPGRGFVTGYVGGAYLWEWKPGQPARRAGSFPHQAGVLCVDVSPDGRSLGTGGTDGAVHWWDVTTGRPLAPAWRYPGLVRAVAFGRGRELPTLLTAGTTLTQGSADLWGLPRPAEGDLERLRAWASVVANTERQAGVAAVMTHERWQEQRQRLGTVLGGMPEVERQARGERRAREPEAVATGRPPEPVPIAQSEVPVRPVVPSAPSGKRTSSRTLTLLTEAAGALFASRHPEGLFMGVQWLLGQGR